MKSNLPVSVLGSLIPTAAFYLTGFYESDINAVKAFALGLIGSHILIEFLPNPFD